jgi:cysteine synthase A
MIYESIIECIGRTPLVYLDRLFPQENIKVVAKLELLNPGGSVKDRPAQFIIQKGLQEGVIHEQTHLIESTSGNLGIAIAMVAQVYNLTFTCVVDPHISPTNLKILELLGANIEMVQELDEQGGYLQSRIKRVRELTQIIPHGFWLNQYANELNWKAHYYCTANEILQSLDRPIDCVVLGVSTTGTIMGISRCLRQRFPDLRVVAVDSVGSVIFGGSPKPRHIPGIGASRVPEILREIEIDEVIYVSELETVQACRELVAYEGILAGGSSGSVIAAIRKLLSTVTSSYSILTLLPDRGERYLNMVYDDDWVKEKFNLTELKLPVLTSDKSPILS